MGKEQQTAHICPNCGAELPQQYLQLPLREALASFERDYVAAQMRSHQGNASCAARTMKIDRVSIYRILKRFGLSSSRTAGRPRHPLVSPPAKAAA